MAEKKTTEPTTYAVIADGNREHRVRAGDRLEVDLRADAAEGATVTFDQVRLVSDGKEIRVGAPAVPGASVTAKVIRQTKGDKIRIVKFRRRKGYKKVTGHRQKFTLVEITKIST